jgi:hypothetical protein
MSFMVFPGGEHSPEHVTVGLDEMDSTSATDMVAGCNRISIDLGVNVTLIGTPTQLLDLGSSITSHVYAILAERESRETGRKVA